jgi:16S rRNA processing protein RimM
MSGQGAGGEWVTRATIRAAHGIRGYVRATLATDFPERLLAAKQVQLRRPSGAVETWAVERAEPYKQGILLKLAGIDDRTAAEGLAGCELVAPAAELPPLAAGEYYWHQLMGLRVVTEDGQEVGVIDDILRTGSNDVYVTAREVRGRRREGPLIPAIADVVARVDLDQRTMVIRPLPGLLE